MAHTRNILITGNSSGIGYGLTQVYLERGWSVYGLSRRGSIDLPGNLLDVRCDLCDFPAAEIALTELLSNVEKLHLVILNAGILGVIRELHDTPISDIKSVMDINVWANKAIMDWLHGSGIEIDQIIFMSSGAAVNASKGWGGYALSKAALNMLAKLYVHEFPDTHITAFAPGIVHTPMLDEINRDVDACIFPSAKVLQDAISTRSIPNPREAGQRLADVFEKLPAYPSGSFLDIRTMDA